MDKKEIMSVWAAFQEVQEKKKAKLDPVGKADGDIDNDGDEDESDEYLANRRKKVGAAMKKEGKIPPQFAKKGEKDDDDEEESDEKSEKPKKGENPFAKKDKKDVKESEESPYPSLDKKKREKKGSNLEDAGGPAAKLKGEAVEEGNAQCPKCEGKGTVNGKTCNHCDGEGYHAKESYGKKMKESNLFSADELAALEEKMGPGATGGAPEKMGQTASAGEKKFADDHKKSDKKFEDMEEVGEMDAVKAGRGVKSQSPARNAGDKLSNGDSKTPSKP